jgi:hypothetical protein
MMFDYRVHYLWWPWCVVVRWPNTVATLAMFERDTLIANERLERQPMAASRNPEAYYAAFEVA